MNLICADTTKIKLFFIDIISIIDWKLYYLFISKYLNNCHYKTPKNMQCNTTKKASNSFLTPEFKTSLLCMINSVENVSNEHWERQILDAHSFSQLLKLQVEEQETMLILRKVNMIYRYWFTSCSKSWKCCLVYL